MSDSIKLYIASLGDSMRVQDLARPIMTPEHYHGQEVRTWLQGDLITTPHAEVADLLRAIAKIQRITILEGDDIPHDPQGWFLDSIKI